MWPRRTVAGGEHEASSPAYLPREVPDALMRIDEEESTTFLSDLLLLHHLLSAFCSPPQHMAMHRTGIL